MFTSFSKCQSKKESTRSARFGKRAKKKESARKEANTKDPSEDSDTESESEDEELPKSMEDLLEQMEQEDEDYGDELTKPPEDKKLDPKLDEKLDDKAEEELDEELDDVDKEYQAMVEDVMEDYIDKGTRYNYRLNQRRFVVYLYLKGSGASARATELRKLLHPNLVQVLDDVGARGHRGYLKDLREAAQKQLNLASKDYHPIDLQNLDPRVFLEYLLSLTDVKNNEYFKSYGGHRSGLTQLFTQCEVSPTKPFLQKMKRVMSGLKNTAARARGQAGGKLGEGKEPLPFEVYRALCKWLLEDESNESIFGHCFLTLTWNLMCRSKNTVYIQREHIGWIGDAMTVQFAHTKTDREGKGARLKRHLYANPYMPEICAVVSVARYLCSNPAIENGRLFSGTKQYDRFRKLLGRVVNAHKDEIRRMGIDPQDIGVHSIRKGAATYCCNGTTAGVSFPAVCVRAGWSMGNVKDRYLQHMAAGDQVCGRTVCGLDVASHKFSVAPPYFQILSTTIDCNEADVDEGIAKMFGNLPLNWLLLARYLLASMLFHRSMLQTTLHAKSRTRGSPLFRPDFDKLALHVKICFPWNNDDNDYLWRIVFSGLTPTAVNFNFHQEQIEILRDLPEKITANVARELDQRAIGGGNLTAEMIKAQIVLPIQQQLNGMAALNASLESRQSSSTSTITFNGRYTFHNLPKDFELNSKLSVLAAWNCWHLGEMRESEQGKPFTTPAWKELKEGDVSRKKVSRKNLYNAKLLFRDLDKAAGLVTLVAKPGLDDLSKAFQSKSVTQVLEGLSLTAKGRTRRIDQLAWASIGCLYRTAVKSPTKRSTDKKSRQFEASDESDECRTKRRRKANIAHPPSNDDPEIEIIAVKKPAKASNPHAKNRGDVRLDGFNPDAKSFGRMTLNRETDLDPIRQQGLMLTGLTTTGYFNLVVSRYFRYGVRRTIANFFPGIKGNRETHGTKGAWDEYIATVLRIDLNAEEVLWGWNEAPLMIVQIFTGHTRAGHFSLLLIDRTQYKPGIFVYFDSLGGVGTFRALQRVFMDSAYCSAGAKWVHATVPFQGAGTNDCGVYMCCIATAFVKHLVENGNLVDSLVPSNRKVAQNSQVPHYNCVTVTLEKGPFDFGAMGRKHMLASMFRRSIELNSEVFQQIAVSVSMKEGVIV